MKVAVVNEKGKKVEDISLKDAIFGIIPNNIALAQYLRVFQANQRQGTSSTKTRGEVSGGGKKPWRQKGTGRARQGSTRSPLWRHGGVAHGPNPKSWRLSIPQKIKRLAFISAVSFKFKNKEVTVLDEFKLAKPETKKAKELLTNLNLLGKTLIVLADNDLNLRKSVSNLGNVKTALVENVNAYELLWAKDVLFLKSAILKVQEKYADK